MRDDDIPEPEPLRGLLKLLILKEIEKRESTGYELIKRIGSKISKEPSPGSVYPLLRELAGAGFLDFRIEGNKKLYSISDRGKAVLEEATKREKEAILRKIEVLKASGILKEDEAVEMFEFVKMKREAWLRLFEIENWSKFISLVLGALEISRSDVEAVIADAIKKLEEIEGGNKGE